MISNPCRWFINGRETESFTYEGGSRLYHFSVVDSNISNYHFVNVVFFANNEAHALNVLIRMFEFGINAHTKYSKRSVTEHVHEELLSRNDSRIKDIELCLEALRGGKYKITLAPTNQMFKVGWAYNDTIL